MAGTKRKAEEVEIAALTEAPALSANDDDTRYAAWKSNACVIYDTLLHHNVVWPSLCVAWGAQRAVETEPPLVQQPMQDGEEPHVEPAYDKCQELFFSSRTDGDYNAGSRIWNGHPHMLYSANVLLPEPHMSNYRGVGKFSETKKSGRINITKRIVHPGEVNKMRLCPQNDAILATHSDSPLTYVWNMRTQTTGADKLGATASVPDLTLVGHTEMAEYALAWCAYTPSVVSGGGDAQVLIWSIEDQMGSLAAGGNPAAGGVELKPRCIFQGHTETVEDVKYDPRSQNGLECCSVGDDMCLFFWDGRAGLKPTNSVVRAHDDDINCVVWNPFDGNVVCTGASDGSIHQYDIRNLSTGSVRHLGVGVEMGNITNMQWSPHSAHHFASAGDGGSLYIWDISKADTPHAEMEPWDTTPAELMFKHMGHRAPVVDFDWNAKSPWTIATFSDDGALGGGTLQMWRVADLVYNEQPDFLEKLQHVLDTEQNGADKVVSDKNVEEDGDGAVGSAQYKNLPTQVV